MHAHCSYDYAAIRVVPRVERQEFVNAGVILWCREQEILEARVELDESRLRALDATVDLDAVRRHLASFSIICAGGTDATIIQTSAVHSGRCNDVAATLERLLDALVRPAK